MGNGETSLRASRARARGRLRVVIRSIFFLLFIFAPPLNLLRFDLDGGHAYFLGLRWTLGLEPFLKGEAGIGAAAVNLLLRGFLPLFGTAALLLGIAWRYGRLYCGWLCPHFSVVEVVNGLMRRARGHPTLWERRSRPERQAQGNTRPRSYWWIPTIAAVVVFALVWAVVLLTYLVSPAEVYSNLWKASLPRSQLLFISIAGTFFLLEFLLARHLFCRFGCAVGLFQSLAWMANDRALIVDFASSRATACASCRVACEEACPMRLKPRDIKRRISTCTQCVECVAACERVQSDNVEGPLLRWVRKGEDAVKARRVSKGEGRWKRP